MYSRKDIAKATGLQEQFIHKVMRQLAEVFAPYTSRGAHNRELIDDNGMAILQQVSTMKQDGKTLPEIVLAIKESGIRTSGKPAGHTASDSGETDVLREWLEDVRRERDRERDMRLEAEQGREDLRKALNNLEGQVKALPADPETIARLWREEQERKAQVARITAELAGLGPFAWRKRKHLVEELRKLTEES